MELDRPTRYVFDEGHHVFDAADSAFSVSFSGSEAADLRRWIRGHEGRQKSRARGIKKRLEDILSGDPDAKVADVDTALDAARILPAQAGGNGLSEAGSRWSCRTIFIQGAQRNYARVSSPDSLYNLEAGLYPLNEELNLMALGLADA